MIVLLGPRGPGRDPREDRTVHRRRHGRGHPGTDRRDDLRGPLQFEDHGLGRLIVRELSLGDPDAARSHGLASARGADQARQAGAQDRPRRQVHRASPTPTSPSPRRAEARRLDRDVDVQDPLGRLGDALEGHPPRRPRWRGGRRHCPAGSGIAGSRARSWPRTSPVTGPALPRAVLLGLQYAVIEFAREVVGAKDVNSTEFDMFTTNPVIDFMPDQRDLGRAGRWLGLYPPKLTPGSRRRPPTAGGHLRAPPAQVRGQQPVPRGARGGHDPWPVAGRDDRRDRGCGPPWFVASQFHEFKSRPERPHPLFDKFVEAALEEGPVARAAGRGRGRAHPLQACERSRCQGRPPEPAPPSEAISPDPGSARLAPYRDEHGPAIVGWLTSIDEADAWAARTGCRWSATSPAGTPTPTSTVRRGSMATSSSATARSGRTARRMRRSWPGSSSRPGTAAAVVGR